MVLDWCSRKVLSWRLSISMDVDFCIEAVEEAIARWGKPDIFNTDQGSQFTSQAFTTMLKDHEIAISMDGKGCWRDNVFVERLWRSVKFEEVYLKAYASVTEARQNLAIYMNFYNCNRPHSTHAASTPEMAYFESLPALKLAAQLTQPDCTYLRRLSVQTTGTTSLAPSPFMATIGWVYAIIFSFVCAVCFLTIQSDASPSWKQWLGSLLVGVCWLGSIWFVSKVHITPWRLLKQVGVVERAQLEPRA